MSNALRTLTNWVSRVLLLWSLLKLRLSNYIFKKACCTAATAETVFCHTIHGKMTAQFYETLSPERTPHREKYCNGPVVTVVAFKSLFMSWPDDTNLRTLRNIACIEQRWFFIEQKQYLGYQKLCLVIKASSPGDREVGFNFSCVARIRLLLGCTRSEYSFQTVYVVKNTEILKLPSLI